MGSQTELKERGGPWKLRGLREVSGIGGVAAHGVLSPVLWTRAPRSRAKASKIDRFPSL